MERQARIVAGRQHALVTLDQLRSIGFDEATIRARAAAERIFRLRDGIYSLTPPSFTPTQRLRSATLACGHGSLLSHFDAAAVLRIAESRPGPIHVTVDPSSGRRTGQLEGIVIHRSSVPAVDAGRGDGIPCTSAARTIFDLAALAGVEELEEMMIAANSLGILNWGRLEELVEAGRGRRGIRALRGLVVEEPERVRSKTEMAMKRICRSIDFEDPSMNRIIEVAGRRFEVDFHWPRLRLVVEVDGYRFHASRKRLNDDRERDQLLTIDGWTVVRFTRDQVIETPAVVAERLRAIVAVTCSGR